THSSRLVTDHEPVHTLVNISPSLVRKAGAELADGHEFVSIAVVHTGEKRSRTKLRSLALAAVVTEQHNVDCVGQLTARHPLQLHPVEVAGAGLVRRVETFGHDPLQAAADVVEQLSGQDLYRVGLREWCREECVGVPDHLFYDLKALFIGERGQVGSV